MSDCCIFECIQSLIDGHYHVPKHSRMIRYCAGEPTKVLGIGSGTNALEQTVTDNFERPLVHMLQLGQSRCCWNPSVLNATSVQVNSVADRYRHNTTGTEAASGTTKPHEYAPACLDACSMDRPRTRVATQRAVLSPGNAGLSSAVQRCRSVQNRCERHN